MLEQLEAFFDRFVADIPSFDGQQLAKLYHSPYVAFSKEADAWVCNNPAETADYFQSLLDRHKSDGVVSSKWENLEFSAIGERCYLASVTWTMLDTKGETVSHWRESYNLIQVGESFEIFTSIDH